MSEGLITRIGQWIDRKWQAKATEGELQEVQRLLNERMNNIGLQINSIVITTKEFQELKDRLGHLEVYVGMKRVVDPTKAAVAKSAFAM